MLFLSASVNQALVARPFGARIECPPAHVTNVFLPLLSVDIDEVFCPDVVRSESFTTPWTSVPDSFTVNPHPVKSSSGSSLAHLPASSAWEAARFVGLHVLPEPRHGHERFAARVAHVVLIVAVHVLVCSSETREARAANLTAESVIRHFERQNTVAVIRMQNFTVTGDHVVLEQR